MGRGGVFSFLIAFLVALVCSPLLMALFQIGAAVRGLEERLVEELGTLREAPSGPPTRFQQRFGGLAGKKGEDE